MKTKGPKMKWWCGLHGIYICQNYTVKIFNVCKFYLKKPEKYWVGLKLSDRHMEFISLFSLLCVCLKKKDEMEVLTYVQELSHVYIHTQAHSRGVEVSF